MPLFLGLCYDVCIGRGRYNIINVYWSGLVAVIFTRALYVSMFANNLASARVLWYAVPEGIKVVAYPVIADILPAGSKGMGALFTLFMQTWGLTAGNEVLSVVMIMGSMFWISIIHTGLRTGYAQHLADSLTTRAGGSEYIQFDVTDSKIVVYIIEFIMLGDAGQRMFILNLLKGHPLDPFYDALIHLYALRPDVSTVVKLIEVVRLHEMVISNEDLLNVINDDYEDPAIVGVTLLAIGSRRLPEATERIEQLLESKHPVVQLSAAISLLHLKPSEEDREKVKAIITKELSLENSTEAREVCLSQLSVTLYQKVTLPPEQDHGGTAQFDFTRLPRPKSRQIKRLGLDYILPMVAQSLTVVGTAEMAAEVLDMFDSKEVQHLFGKLLLAQDGMEEDVRVFYVQPVFDYLAANSKRTYDNKICDTLLNLDLLQNADMIGSKMTSMVFRAVIAVAQNAPLKRLQSMLVKEMIEKELERAYRKLSVLFWLGTVSFSDMLKGFVTHHLHMTKERILMLLAAICPYDPVDEYADVVLMVDDDNEVATAMELIEAVAPPDLWMKIQPIMAPEKDISLADRVRVGKRLYTGMVESIDDALQDYMTSGSEIWPAFVLDLCIKNELYDFLDSIPWPEIQENVTHLYNEKRQGRLTDGSHLLLEIVGRDKQATRRQLQKLKEDLIKKLRREEMKKDMQNMDKGLISNDMLMASDIAADMREAGERAAPAPAPEPMRLGLLGKAKTTLLGESGGEEAAAMSPRSLVLASQDKTQDPMSSRDASQDVSQDASQKQRAKDGDDDSSGWLCFKKNRDYDKLDEKALAAKEMAEMMAEGAEKQRLLEYQVRFHHAFGMVGASELLVLKPEPVRLQQTLESHQTEEDLTVPTVIEMDADIMAGFVDDGMGFDVEASGRKKKTWMSLFRRGDGTHDTFLVVDEEEEAAAKKTKKKKRKEAAGEVETVGPADKREEELINMFHLGYRCDVRLIFD